jgi:hypothetical protein
MRLAIFTIVRNEQIFFPIWLQHYLNTEDACDIYVLDHGSTGDSQEQLQALVAEHRFNLIPVQHAWCYDSNWLRDVTQRFQHFLLKSYKTVLFSAVDELVLPSPESELRLQAMATSLHAMELPYVRCNAFEVVHKHEEEGTLNLQLPWLSQRKWWYPTERYSKPLLARIPMYWRAGWFGAFNALEAVPVQSQLLLVHLHKIDYQLLVERHQQIAIQRWAPAERFDGCLRHNLLEEPEQLSRWILSNADKTEEYANLYEIPRSIKDRLPLCLP